VGVGCHVGQSDLPAAAARAILGPDAILGVSLDEVADLRAVDPAIVDYVAYGPFAATATKADAGRPVGPDGLAAVAKQTMLPLVAIGGIDARNVAEAVRAGADGLAVVSAIMAADDPEAASRALRAAIDAAKAEVEKAL
jgi:thiamine-phosphate pyrophosphorylase